jgi:hypothetical protein
VTTDGELRRTLEEACEEMMPKKPRSFFVNLLIGTENIDASSLWEEFKDHLSEDQAGEQDSQYNRALRLLGQHLSNEEFLLTTFGLPTPKDTEDTIQEDPIDVKASEYVYRVNYSR